jgi:MFS family permease
VTSPAAALAAHPTASDWRRIVAAYWVTQLVESMGMSQVFALMPAHLRELGMPEVDRLAFVGLFSSLVFVLGLPLVPLWGVWADKVSRKAVIVRSALVEAVVFALAAAAQVPWQMAIAMLLIGFQLGNTGVMLAGIRDVTPRKRLATVIAIFGAGSPIGFALGPVLAGGLIDGLGWSIAGVYMLSGALSIGTALLVGLGTREVRPEVIPVGPVFTLARKAVSGVLRDRDVRRLFMVYGVVFLANQISRPFTPLLVERVVGSGAGLATSIAIVIGVGSLVGALISPLAGGLGDRFGYRPVLIASLSVGALASLLLPFMPGVAAMAGASVLLGLAVATTSAMVFSMLATEVPPERRSATLNLVYLPLYIAGIIGPAAGSALAAVAGVDGPFLLGSVVFLAGALTIWRQRRGDARAARDAAAASRVAVGGPADA